MFWKYVLYVVLDESENNKFRLGYLVSRILGWQTNRFPLKITCFVTTPTTYVDSNKTGDSQYAVRSLMYVFSVPLISINV